MTRSCPADANGFVADAAPALEDDGWSSVLTGTISSSHLTLTASSQFQAPTIVGSFNFTSSIMTGSFSWEYTEPTNGDLVTGGATHTAQTQSLVSLTLQH